MTHSISRRDFLATTALASVSLATGRLFAADEPAPETLPPVRTITKGPKHHWFGYYDKLEFDPTSRYVLGMQVDFEHRSPKADDLIGIGMVDLADGDRWIDLGKSAAWSWQQGCMLQWIPGSDRHVLWNDRDEDRFVCRILDTQSREWRTIPAAIYTLSPDGKTAVSPDFRRLNDVRPGYGYAGIPDPYRDEDAPTKSGIWRIDLESGEESLLFSLADIVRFEPDHTQFDGAKHWFNHLLYNPDGSRFVFLHRWRKPGEKGFHTRMLSANRDGKDLGMVDPSGNTSHFVWRDNTHILAWTQPAGQPAAFYVLEDRTAKYEVIGKGVMTVNGHCLYLPGNRWILNDTYPDRQRLQHPYLYEVATGKRVPLGHFHSPPEYVGEWRCDNHPRFSPNGKYAVIDSPHTGAGRQLHLIDLTGIVGG